jgi:hypothetical protein
MPIVEKSLPIDRVEFSENISEREINLIINNKDVKVLQISNPVETESWSIINELLLLQRTDIEIRIYGHYSGNCDLSFIENITNVRNLAMDCLMEASNIEVLSQLPNLESLSVGIYSLENFKFLDSLPSSLTQLFLGSTKSKKLNLSSLSRFLKLKALYIEGHQKGIDTIGCLSYLEKLTLRSVTTRDITFLHELKNLWYLDIKLGGIKDLIPLKRLVNLKYLELWQVRGLSNISFISSLVGLQYLFLQSLCNVTTLPDMTDLHKLRRVHLETMKGLTDIFGLSKAPAIEEFIHVDAQSILLAQYHCLFQNKSLKSASIGFGSYKNNLKILNLMKTMEIEKYSYTPFKFR